jgi:membrane-anchored protein YejM (alkaline phosphatase superfamily)
MVTAQIRALRAVDDLISALLYFLQRLFLLDETIVVWLAAEFQ